MTLEMSYREKFEEGVEQGIEQGIIRGVEQEKTETAVRMIKDGDLSFEKIALYSGLTIEQVIELNCEKNED